MKLLSLLACLFAISVRAQISIIPQPASVRQPKIAAKFSITSSTQIVLEGSNLENIAGYLNDYFQQFYGFKLKIVKTTSSTNAIILNYDRLDDPLPGAYEMTVNNKGVYIGGDNEEGVFYGVQTLIQLLPVDNKSQTTNNNFKSLMYQYKTIRVLHIGACILIVAVIFFLFHSLRNILTT
jgi:hexosaminidase